MCPATHFVCQWNTSVLYNTLVKSDHKILCVEQHTIFNGVYIHYVLTQLLHWDEPIENIIYLGHVTNMSLHGEKNPLKTSPRKIVRGKKINNLVIIDAIGIN